MEYMSVYQNCNSDYSDPLDCCDPANCVDVRPVTSYCCSRPVATYFSEWRTVDCWSECPAVTVNSVSCEPLPPLSPLPPLPPLFQPLPPPLPPLSLPLPPLDPFMTVPVSCYDALPSYAPLPPVALRPLIPVTAWQNVLVNLRRGNLSAALSMLSDLPKIVRRQLKPVLRTIFESYRNRPGVAQYPVTYLV